MALCSAAQDSYAGLSTLRSQIMVLCPIAIAVGCKKCPAFSICPLKSVIGDQKPPPPPVKKP
jgi:hypothetical protein